jgi:hypothetical protein
MTKYESYIPKFRADRSKHNRAPIKTHRKSEYSSLTKRKTRLLFPTADSPVNVDGNIRVEPSVERELRIPKENRFGLT